MIQVIRVAYGRIRYLLGLTQYVPIRWHFDSGQFWMVYDSYRQVYISGTISGNEQAAYEYINELIGKDA